MTRIRKNLAIHLARMHALIMHSLPEGEIEPIARHVSEWTGQNPSHPLITFSRALTEKATRVPNKFAEDVEKALLDRVSTLPFRHLFDVGTNVGTWSR